MRAGKFLILFALVIVAYTSNPASSSFLKKEFHDEAYKHSKFIDFDLDSRDSEYHCPMIIQM